MKNILYKVRVLLSRVWTSRSFSIFAYLFFVLGALRRRIVNILTHLSLTAHLSRALAHARDLNYRSLILTIIEILLALCAAILSIYVFNIIIYWLSGHPCSSALAWDISDTPSWLISPIAIVPYMQIVETTFNEKRPNRLTILLENNNLYEGREALEAIYNSLTAKDTFTDFAEYKVILVSALWGYNREHSIHCNTLIGPETSFDDYYSSIESDINHFYEQGYYEGVFPTYRVTCYNVDRLRNTKVKITRDATTLRVVSVTDLSEKLDKLNTTSARANAPTSQPLDVKGLSSNNPFSAGQKRSFHSSRPLQVANINPLSKKYLDRNPKPFCTFDLETVEYVGNQIPVAITMAYIDQTQVSNGLPLNNKIFYINYLACPLGPGRISVNKLILKLFKDYFNFIIANKLILHFAHNLGGFDGIFLFKYLNIIYKPEQISVILDKENKFISIKLKVNESLIIEWKDSLRLFPVSLNDFCNSMGVEGKVEQYDPSFNKLDMFKNPDLLNRFIDYALQDSISLHKALTKAQKYYLDNYQIDICKLYSLPSLALKIYRAHFMPKDIKGIPILSPSIDGFVRTGYIGGAVDTYKEYGENIKHYDVNSLYPYAQSLEMPYECLGYRSKVESLDSFFGFLEVEVDCPLDLTKPMLPLRVKNQTIFPVGKWKGVYFSEELKAVLPLGYKFKLLSGYEFSKKVLFDKYVSHFYEQKRYATGTDRYIAKLMLNSLYGIFGRKSDKLTPIIVRDIDIDILVATVKIHSTIQITDTHSLLLIDDDKSSNILKEINCELENHLSTFKLEVKSNVAIAAAITAYARIHMIPLKLNYDCYYSDTDSTFTTVDLGKVAPHLVGPELGQLKDELSGTTIDQALFLGIKQYGYTFSTLAGDSNDNTGASRFGVAIERSVWAGVERDSISFDEIKKLATGEVIRKESKPRFLRNMKELSLSITPVSLNINRSLSKKVINNQYIPPVIWN